MADQTTAPSCEPPDTGTAPGYRRPLTWAIGAFAFDRVVVGAPSMGFLACLVLVAKDGVLEVVRALSARPKVRRHAIALGLYVIASAAIMGGISAPGPGRFAATLNALSPRRRCSRPTAVTTRRHHGSTQLRLTPLELIERLAALIPPPAHPPPSLPRGAGAQVSAASQVTAWARPPSPPLPAARPAQHSERSPAHYLWAVLLARIYEILPLRCTLCAG